MDLLPDLTTIDGALHDIVRKKTRFYGIGPLINEKSFLRNQLQVPSNGATNAADKFWPRDFINPERETTKLLNSIRVPHQITSFLIEFFDRLRRANIQSLLDSCCPRDKFGRAQFSIHRALDAYAPQSQVVKLTNMIVQSLNMRRDSSGQNYIKTLFGSNANYNIFKKHLKWIVVGNARLTEIRLSHFLTFADLKMDINQITWLRGIESLYDRCKLFMQLIHAIVRHILEVLRRYFYITVSGPYYDRLFYYRYDLWQKMEHKVLMELIDEGIIKPFVVDDTVIMPCVPGAISRYKFHLKLDSLRLICTNIRDSNLNYNGIFFKLKAILEHVLIRLKNYRKFNLLTLLQGLKAIRERAILSSGKVYFVKADIRNCFQSIDQDLLLSIIMDSLRETAEKHGGDIEFIRLTKLTGYRAPRRGSQKPMSRWCVEEDSHALIEKNETLSVIERLDLELRDIEDVFLRPNIIQPVLRKSKSSAIAFRLMRGIRQGSPVSPLFSAIYIQTALNQYMPDILNSDDCQLFCHVDDILFMSTDIYKARDFIHKLLKGYKDYNLETNLDKLQCNFPHRGLDERFCPLGDHIVFHNQQIKLDTFRCSYDNKTLRNTNIMDTFKVSPYIEARSIINLLINYRFPAIHLDEELNDFEHVAQNIYEKALQAAHRTAAMLLISFKFRSHQKMQSGSFIIRCIRILSRRAYKAIQTAKKYGWITNSFCYEFVRILVTAAFKVTWERRQVAIRWIERRKIEGYFNRCLMWILIDKDRDLESSRRFEMFARKLTRSECTKFFIREVSLPEKPY